VTEYAMTIPIDPL